MSIVAANRVVHTPAEARTAGRPPSTRPGRAATAAPRPGDPGITNLTDVHLVSANHGSSLYQGMQISPRRPVAVKVLHDELDSPAGERFDRERAVIAQLSGQSAVVPLFETGVTAAGDPYLLQAWYGRGSLARLVSEHGALSWQEAAFLVEPVAVALAEVHSQGYVHRDLRPANVLLTDFLLPRLTNFGLTLPVGVCSTPATIAPSPFFSPPELGEPIETDPRADVYGLGALLWALLTGQVAFDDDAGVLARTATAQARTGRWDPPSPDTPLPLLDLIARSMADDPEERPMSAASFVTELRRAVAPPPPAGADADADEVADGRAIDLRSGQLSVATAISAFRAPTASAAGAGATHPAPAGAGGPGDGSTADATGPMDLSRFHPGRPGPERSGSAGFGPDQFEQEAPGPLADGWIDREAINDDFDTDQFDPDRFGAEQFDPERFEVDGYGAGPDDGYRHVSPTPARTRPAPRADAGDLPPTGLVAERRPGPGPAGTALIAALPPKPAGRTQVRLTAGPDEVRIGPADARYVLILVGCIVAMVAAMLVVAIFGVG